LRFLKPGEPETRVVDVKEDTRCTRSRTPERKKEEEKSEDPEKISIVDRGGSRRDR
jgi:hypothetical protein